MKIIDAHGRISRNEITELVKLALNARTHVKDSMKESISCVFSYFSSKKAGFGLAREMDAPHFHVDDIDLIDSCVEDQFGVAFFRGSLLGVTANVCTLILGNMNIHGNIKKFRPLTEPLELARDDGVKRTPIPIQNKPQFLKVIGDISKHIDSEPIDPVCYRDLKAAAFKALGMN